jgi:hypothetical protein
MLSKDTAFVTSYFTEQVRLKESLHQIDLLTKHDLKQQQNLKILRNIHGKWIGFREKNIYECKTFRRCFATMAN